MRAEKAFLILGLDQTSTQEQIKKQYRKLIRKHHPDVGGDSQYASLVIEAYLTLTKINKRIANSSEVNSEIQRVTIILSFEQLLKVKSGENMHFSNGTSSVDLSCSNIEKFNVIISEEISIFISFPDGQTIEYRNNMDLKYTSKGIYEYRVFIQGIIGIPVFMRVKIGEAERSAKDRLVSNIVRFGVDIGSSLVQLTVERR